VLRKAIGAAKAGALSTAGTIAKAVSSHLAGVIGSSGALVVVRAILLTLGGTMGSAGALTKQGRKALTGTLGSAATLARAVSAHPGGILGAAGALTRKALKTVSGAMTPSGALAVVRAVLLTLTGALGSSGTLQRKTTKALSATLTSAATLSRFASTHFAGSLAPTGAIRKLIGRTFTAVLSWGGALTSRVMGSVPPIHPPGQFTADDAAATFALSRRPDATVALANGHAATVTVVNVESRFTAVDPAATFVPDLSR
jgi:hypothetical protein